MWGANSYVCRSYRGKTGRVYPILNWVKHSILKTSKNIHELYFDESNLDNCISFSFFLWMKNEKQALYSTFCFLVRMKSEIFFCQKFKIWVMFLYFTFTTLNFRMSFLNKQYCNLIITYCHSCNVLYDYVYCWALQNAYIKP